MNIYNFALISSLFPWFSFGILEGGIQPFYMLAMAIALFTYILLGKRISREYFLFFIPILFILFNIFSDEISRSEFFREIVGYFSMVMSFIFFRQYLRLFGFPKRIILYAVVVSVAAGVLQVLIDEKIFEHIVHARTTGGRGVTGFTSEPGYYGMHLALLISLLLLSSREKLMKLMLLSLFGLLLSASVVAAYFYLTFIGSVAILKKILTLKTGLILLFMGGASFFFVFLDMRFGHIVYLLLNNGLEGLYSQDSSAQSRISQSLTPFILSYYDYFLPAADSVIAKIGSIDQADSIHNFLSSDNKIGSYIGRLVFHFGLFFIIPLMFLLLYLFLNSSIRQILAVLLIILALFPAISPGYPVLIYFLVYFIHCYPVRFHAIKK